MPPVIASTVLFYDSSYGRAFGTTPRAFHGSHALPSITAEAARQRAVTRPAYGALSITAPQNADVQRELQYSTQLLGERYQHRGENSLRITARHGRSLTPSVRPSSQPHAQLQTVAEVKERARLAATLPRPRVHTVRPVTSFFEDTAARRMDYESEYIANFGHDDSKRATRLTTGYRNSASSSTNTDERVTFDRLHSMNYPTTRKHFDDLYDQRNRTNYPFDLSYHIDRMRPNTLPSQRQNGRWVRKGAFEQ